MIEDLEMRAQPSRTSVGKVLLTGKLKRSDVTLLCGGSKIRLSLEGGFRFEIGAGGKGIRLSCQLQAGDKKGSAEMMQIVWVQGSEAQSSAEGSTEGIEKQGALRGTKVDFWSPGLSYTQIRYRETGLGEAESAAITAKLVYQSVLVPQVWSISGNVFFTAQPLGEILPGKSARFLGLNLRVAFELPSFTGTLSASIAGGPYYSKMFASSEDFGHPDLAYLQIYPAVKYRLHKSGVVGSYLKWVPFSSEWGTNREFSGGAYYTQLLSKGRAVSANVDISSVKLHQFGQSEYSLGTTSFGVSYVF